MAPERACHASSSKRTGHGASGTARRSMVAENIRPAITLESGTQRCHRAAVAHCRAAMRPPLLSMLCQPSPPATRLPVQALQGLGDGVDRTRGPQQPLDWGPARLGAPPRGLGPPRAARAAAAHACGGAAGTGSADTTVTARGAVRGGCAPRRGPWIVAVASTGWAATVAHP